MKIKCLIVDDEPLAIKVLENYVERIENLELGGACRNAVEAFNLLKNQPVDLIFLDIQMPQISGINFLKTLENPPKIIFTTAYRDFAVESYELNALDYLVKPIAFERFLKAINKIIPSKDKSLQIEPNSKQESYAGLYIYLKSDKKIFKILLKDIVYIESLKDYIIVHTSQKEKILTYQNISHIEEILPKDKFLRIHRSFIVSIDNIHSFNAVSIFLTEIELPIGRTFKEQVLTKLGFSG